MEEAINQFEKCLKNIIPDSLSFCTSDFDKDIIPTVSQNLLNSIQSTNKYRILEFSAGRMCAQKAIQKLLHSHYSYEIFREHNGLPLWPKEIVGSISHKKNYCVAICGLKSEFISIGVDIECCEKSDLEIITRICVAPEIECFNSCPLEKKNIFASLMISAKEAFFKYQFPITNLFIDFDDIHIYIDWNNFSFYIINIFNQHFPLKLTDHNFLGKFAILNHKFLISFCTKRQ